MFVYIKMNKLKSLYQRYRAWQKQPLPYRLKSDTTHHCQNCGNEFVGNYCPLCSQKAGMGRVTWQSVREGVMEIWGVGNRSMPYSLWQLLLRPGYFIYDYISGKRQVSFPPVKMLIILSVIVTIISNVFGTDTSHHIIRNTSIPLLQSIDEWYDNNPGWVALLSTVFFLLPTWFIFRFSPRYPRHTIPEGFFIQVFLAVIQLFFSLLRDVFSSYLSIAFFIYTYIIYKQLFGYGWFATLWRTILTLIISFVGIITLFMYFIKFDPDSGISNSDYWIFVGIVILLDAILLTITYLIGRRGEKRRMKKLSK